MGDTENKSYADFQHGLEYAAQAVGCARELHVSAGKVPDDIAGRLYRNGPGKHDVGGHPNGHWVDGDGLIAMFNLFGGRVQFRSDFVRTQRFQEEERAGRRLYVTFGTTVPGQPWRNYLIVNSQIKNPVNINAVEHAGRLLALNEGGAPYALDPLTLEPWREESYQGQLTSAFSAHPKIAPWSGDLYNVGLRYGTLEMPAAYVWRVSKAGAIHQLAKLRIPHLTSIHDFCITQRYIVITYSPLYMPLPALLKVMVGKDTLSHALTWHGHEASIIYVLDIATGALVRRYEMPAMFQSHVANAFEDGDEVVFDAIFYPDEQTFKLAGEVIHSGRHPVVPISSLGSLYRIRLGQNGRIAKDQLTTVPVDLPTYDCRLTGKRYRYIYLVEKARDVPTVRLWKLDTESGKMQSFDHGPRCFPGEATFVPARDARTDDDGWLLSLVYDAKAHRSSLSVVDARGLDAEIARVELPFHIPHGFHCSFTDHRAGSP